MAKSVPHESDPFSYQAHAAAVQKARLDYIAARCLVQDAQLVGYHDGYPQIGVGHVEIRLAQTAGNRNPEFSISVYRSVGDLMRHYSSPSDFLFEADATVDASVAYLRGIRDAAKLNKETDDA